MALIACPDCAKQHSDLAPACPNCARPNLPSIDRVTPGDLKPCPKCGESSYSVGLGRDCPNCAMLRARAYHAEAVTAPAPAAVARPPAPAQPRAQVGVMVAKQRRQQEEQKLALGCLGVVAAVVLLGVCSGLERRQQRETGYDADAAARRQLYEMERKDANDKFWREAQRAAERERWDREARSR